MFTPLPLFPRLPQPHPLAACLALALGFSLTVAQAAENPAFPAHDRLDSTFAAPSQSGALRSAKYSPRQTTPSSASTHYVDTCTDDNSAHSLRTLVGLAASGDTIDLTQIPRIVVELRDKIGAAGAWEAASAKHSLSPDDQKINDATLALMALGFKQIEAHDAVRAAQAMLGATATVEQLVRACLKKG